MKIRDIILWLLFIVAIIVVAWYIFGNSPSFEQAMLVLILTLIYAISTKISDVGARMNHMKKRFYALEKRFINLINLSKSIKKRK